MRQLVRQKDCEVIRLFNSGSSGRRVVHGIEIERSDGSRKGVWEESVEEIVIVAGRVARGNESLTKNRVESTCEDSRLVSLGSTTQEGRERTGVNDDDTPSSSMILRLRPEAVRKHSIVLVLYDDHVVLDGQRFLPSTWNHLPRS